MFFSLFSGVEIINVLNYVREITTLKFKRKKELNNSYPYVDIEMNIEELKTSLVNADILTYEQYAGYNYFCVDIDKFKKGLLPKLDNSLISSSNNLKCIEQNENIDYDLDYVYKPEKDIYSKVFLLTDGEEYIPEKNNVLKRVKNKVNH